MSLGLSLARCVPGRSTLLFSAMVIALSGCHREGIRIVTVDDPAQTNEFRITSTPSRHCVSGLTLHFQGQIDGTAYVWAANWPTQTLNGNVDWLIYHDWFETNCTIYYQPSGVHTGSLKFQYEFH
jgi:hypothetical protein